MRSRWLLVLWAVAFALAVPNGDQLARVAPHPDDPALLGGSQWNLAAIGAPAAWPRATGRGITIAIIDSGIDLRHQDLAAHIVGSTDCIGAHGDPGRCHGQGQDDDGHGSHVAGIAAAVTDNGRGVAGVAPGADLMAVRVLTDTCFAPDCSASGSTLDVVAGIRWATAHHADVINLSIGAGDGSLDTRAVASAIVDAWNAGVIVVAAAGNRTITAGLADLPVLVVTAVDRRLTLADYARGVGDAPWGLAAPGGEAGDTPRSCRARGNPVGVLSTSWDPAAGPDQYACLAGTSMAAPHVAGAAAVLRSLGYSPQGTVDRLLATARDLGHPGLDAIYGAGLLALDRAAQSPTEPLRSSPPALGGGTALAAGGSAAIAGTIAPRPARPPLLPSLLLGSLISLCGAAAIMLGRHMWDERGAGPEG